MAFVIPSSLQPGDAAQGAAPLEGTGPNARHGVWDRHFGLGREVMDREEWK
jgi:hypothetical protein